MRFVNAHKSLLNSTKARPATLSAQLPMPPESIVPKMLEMISQTREVELSCDEVNELLDQFAELVQRGEDVAEIMPMVKYHVDMCADCREEFEALMRILEHVEQ